MQDLQTVLAQFQLSGTLLRVQNFGNGHINDSYAAYLHNRAGVYRVLLQKVNTHTFPDVDGLMQNILSVTAYLAQAIRRRGGDPGRETLSVVPTRGGAPYYRDAAGACWRVYRFIEGTVAPENTRSSADLYSCGLAFGRFLADLDGYPAGTLCETIPGFHNTAKRFEDFVRAAQADSRGRAALAREEIAFAFAHRALAFALTAPLREGKLPLRVTHNDTKVNNVLLDEDTRKGLCVVDLDTVMPGLSLYDFGDSIRSGASTGAEDERDLSKVSLSLPLFRAFAKGFLTAAGERLTPLERRLLPLGAQVMTFECGLRFLTDYLCGDKYYKIHRQGHNLDRCRTQFKLVADMANKQACMRAVIDALNKRA